MAVGACGGCLMTLHTYRYLWQALQIDCILFCYEQIADDNHALSPAAATPTKRHCARLSWQVRLQLALDVGHNTHYACLGCYVYVE